MQIKLFGWRLTLVKDRPIPFGMWTPVPIAERAAPYGKFPEGFSAASKDYLKRANSGFSFALGDAAFALRTDEKDAK